MAHGGKSGRLAFGTCSGGNTALQQAAASAARAKECQCSIQITRDRNDTDIYGISYLLILHVR